MGAMFVTIFALVPLVWPVGWIIGIALVFAMRRELVRTIPRLSQENFGFGACIVLALVCAAIGRFGPAVSGMNCLGP